MSIGIGKLTKLKELHLNDYNVVKGKRVATPVHPTEEQAAAALQVANGDMQAATKWLQRALREGGVAGLETAVSQLPPV